VPLQQRVLGPTHRDTLNSQRLLARILEYQAQFPQAEKLYKDTLQKQGHTFGTGDIDTVRTMIGLGTLYGEQGRYADAEKTLMPALKQAEKIDHESPEAFNALHNLAIAYDGTRQYAREQAMWQELYRRRLQKLGPDHPETIGTMQNLGYVYYRQGKLAEAEKWQREGLSIGRRVLGEDHPTNLYALGNLANTLVDEGRASEAEPLQREALASRRRVLGPNHPQTQFALANLANVLLAENRLAEAEAMYREALAGEIKALGENHPEIGYAWYNLASSEAAQGKRADALRDLGQAVHHGYNDPDEISKAKEWKPFQNDPAYQSALALMKSNAPQK